MPIPAYVANVVLGKGVPPAELDDAACRTPEGVRIVDGYFNAQLGDNSVARRKAQELCRRCPVLNACDTWITQAENPPGSWHGIYAGKTPTQRKEATDGAVSA